VLKKNGKFKICVDFKKLNVATNKDPYPYWVAIIKQDIIKLLATCFITPIEEATWLSPVVIMLKKNGKLKICVDFKKLNVATKKDPYPLPFTDEVINTIARHEVYTFLDDFFGYHQISITSENWYKIAFITN
jgi:hypothetical protein